MPPYTEEPLMPDVSNIMAILRPQEGYFLQGKGVSEWKMVRYFLYRKNAINKCTQWLRERGGPGAEIHIFDHGFGGCCWTAALRMEADGHISMEGDS